jgi:hypothetical protein
MEFPTSKTLPFVAIFAMGTTILSLATYIVAREQQCAAERKEWVEKYERLLHENTIEKRELNAAFNRYVIRNDSIAQAHLLALSKLKKR